MSIWGNALGMNVSDNPILDNPFVEQFHVGTTSPIVTGDDLTTEGGVFILLENGDQLTTE